MKTSKGNITSSSAIHGVVLDGADVDHIFAVLDSMGGDYPYVAEEIRHVINGADLSCHRCEPDCCDVRVCECGTEFDEDGGTTREDGNFCDACLRAEVDYWAAECRTHVPGVAEHAPGKVYEGAE